MASETSSTTVTRPKTLQVCKICFNASSQKTTPILTQESKSFESNNKKWCPTCKLAWSSLTVAQDIETNKWVTIRQRPKMTLSIDYAVCHSVQKKQLCSKGLGQCTYAHSKSELLIWNLDRWKEPRPLPTFGGSYQMQLCRFVLSTGGCNLGQKCPFAHSNEELVSWININKERGGGVVSNISSNTQKFENKSQFFSGASPRSGAHGIRPRPQRIPVAGFRLCISIKNQKRCYHGNRCTYAHSEPELEAWNQERISLRRSRVAAGLVPPKQYTSNPLLPSPPTTANTNSIATTNNITAITNNTATSNTSHEVISHTSGLDDFEEATPTAPPPVDFAHKIRTTVMLDYQEKDPDKDLKGLEKTVQGVTVSLFGDQSETLTVSNTNSNPLLWVFEITTTTPRTLQSVVLFDVLDPNYTIGNIELLSYNGRNGVPVQSKASQGEGLLVNQALNPTEKITVKIDLLKPPTGLLGQTVLFDFGSFYVLRCLSVYIVSDQDRRALTFSQQRNAVKRPGKVDLFWDQHYNIIPWSKDELSDSNLEEYSLPVKVEELIESDKYKNVEMKVKKGSYVRRMHNLLYLEEYQRRKDISRYDLSDIKVDIKDRLETEGEWINDPNYSFIHIDMNEVLFEGTCSIRKDDYCLIKPHNQNVVHQSVVHFVQRESVIIKITKTAKEACMSSRNQVSMRFSPSRIAMRTMHKAVDSVHLDVLFPESTNDAFFEIDSRCLQELERSVLNNEQRRAVRSMIDPKYVSIPTLVLGPFGCGKTRTLLECVSLLSRYEPNGHILICTHTNSAADIYVEAIHTEWLKHNNLRPKMCRIYFKDRNIRSISPTVLSYCNINKERSLYEMTADQIMSYSIVVTTTITARGMLLGGVRKGFFTHILLDEAAQVYEAEELIPLSLADKNTKIVVAGDTMQMDPPVYSPIARRYGLNISLLERLFDLDYYSSGPGAECKVHLTENHRSHEQILYLPSKLFYNDSLTCKAQFPPDGPKHIPRLQFVGVDGHEKQDDDSPSYYNNEEVFKIVEEVEQLHRGSSNPQQCLGLSDICVLSYFNHQVQRIRSCLREKRLGQVQVHRIDNVQGKEFRALLISTVRSCHTQDDNDDGFLNNVKLFNTAITRAKEWLIVVGEPITLCTVGYNSQCWLEFIKQCIELKSFRYPRNELFLNFLETKVVARHILHNHHKEFITKTTNITNATTGVPNQVFTADTRPLAQQLSALTLTPQQKALHVKSRVLSFMQGKDTDIANKITEDLLKLGPSQFTSFLNDEIASKHVKDMEGALRRKVAAENVQVQNDTSIIGQPSNVSNTVMGDLPQFLKTQVDALTAHLRFCDTKCPPNTVPNMTPEYRNIQEQRTLLMKQMNLLNEQILKYREYLKLPKYNTPQHSNSSGGGLQLQQFPQHNYQQPGGGGGYPSGGHYQLPPTQNNFIPQYGGGAYMMPPPGGRLPLLDHVTQGAIGLPTGHYPVPPPRAPVMNQPRRPPYHHHNAFPHPSVIGGGPLPQQQMQHAHQTNFQRDTLPSSMSAPGPHNRPPAQQLSSRGSYNPSLQLQPSSGSISQTTQLISPINDLSSINIPPHTTTNRSNTVADQQRWDSDDDLQ